MGCPGSHKRESHDLSTMHVTPDLKARGLALPNLATHIRNGGSRQSAVIEGSERFSRPEIGVRWLFRNPRAVVGSSGRGQAAFPSRSPFTGSGPRNTG